MHPVLNGGVPAYGIDQAVLRAEILLEEHLADTVVLSFISDDISRTEFAYYPYGRGAKPYFQHADGQLHLRNVPVPRLEEAVDRLPTLRFLLGFSSLANFTFARTSREWWFRSPAIKQVHSDGEDVSVALLKRLDQVGRERGIPFVAVALPTDGRMGGNDRISAVVERIRTYGVQTLDLHAEFEVSPPGELTDLFRPGGHYTPAMNAWVAGRVAEFLR